MSSTMSGDATDEIYRIPNFFNSQPLDSGWMSWNLHDRERYNVFIEPLAVRREEDSATGAVRVRVRMQPKLRHSNPDNVIHGAVTLGFIDVSLFACAHQLCLQGLGHAVTLSLDTQFIGAGRVDEPLDSVVELVQETGRLLFLRGRVVQGEQDSHIVASFSAMVRKFPRKGNRAMPDAAPVGTESADSAENAEDSAGSAGDAQDSADSAEK